MSDALEAEILKAADQAWKKFQVRKEKLNRGRAKWQRDIDEANRKVEDAKHRVDEAKERAEELRRESALRELNQRFIEKTVRSEDSLVCPSCGDSDHGNKMNGKPWCLKCNSPLIPKRKLAEYRKLPNVKVLPKPWKESITYRVE